MSALSDVLRGSGGAVPFLTGDEAIRTLSASQTTTVELLARINKAEPVIVRCTTDFARDCIPDTGRTIGDFINFICAPDSPYIYRAQTETAGNGHRKLVLALRPGARGYLRWNGTEWIWFGYGEYYGPLPMNAHVGPADVGQSIEISDANGHEQCGVMLTPRKALIVGRNNADTTQIFGYIQGFDANGVSQTPGTATMLHNDANTVQFMRTTVLSPTVVVLTYEDTLSSQVDSRVLTISGTTITPSTSQYNIPSATVGSQVYVTAFRDDPTKFVVHHHGTAFGTYNMGCKVGTITGTGAGAAISYGATVETFNASKNNSHDASTSTQGIMVDPSVSGRMFMRGAESAGVSTEMHWCAKDLSGTTLTNHEEWNVEHQGIGGNIYGNTGRGAFLPNQEGGIAYENYQRGNEALTYSWCYKFDSTNGPQKLWGLLQPNMFNNLYLRYTGARSAFFWGGLFVLGDNSGSINEYPYYTLRVAYDSMQGSGAAPHSADKTNNFAGAASAIYQTWRVTISGPSSAEPSLAQSGVQASMAIHATQLCLADSGSNAEGLTVHRSTLGTLGDLESCVLFETPSASRWDTTGGGYAS